MGAEVYNLIWVGPANSTSRHPVSHDPSGNTINRPIESARAVILFPALLTPLVFVESADAEFIELIVASDKDLAASPDFVNRQLKVSPGLDSTKPYDPRPLFGGVSRGNIAVTRLGRVENLALGGSNLAQTDSAFQGILHHSIPPRLIAAGLTTAYKISVHKSCLRVATPSATRSCSWREPKFVGYDNGTTRVRAPAVVGSELSDVLLRAMLDRYIGEDNSEAPANKASTVPGNCRYAFPQRDGKVVLSRIDREQPVQTYHPVFVYPAGSLECASFGHLSDLHVNSRWQILAKSPARVIEYGDGRHEDESPRVGSLVCETTPSVSETLLNVCESAADVVIIGGDLIDHIRNAYDPTCYTDAEVSTRKVWSAVDLTDDGYTPERYPYGVDLTVIYSLVVHAIREFKKPIFGIGGNHDCYVDAFGISPRVLTKRANAGIPADLNLTFYEALLAFGPTSGVLRKLGSSFKEQWFEWFFTVFTPFCDWSHRLPKQSLVGLGWGPDEDLYTPGGDQGKGHLPRSEGVSAQQFDLLKRAVDGRKTHKVTLTTHFTFISFDESLPNNSQGMLERDNDNKFEYGTFRFHREEIISMLVKKEIECVLTGHSHRRGVYLLDPDRSGRCWLFDAGGQGLNLKKVAPGHGAQTPAIIVSDSAGPYPRHNRRGEFLRWGSDKPGGTLVTFDPSTGHPDTVRTIAAEGRPMPRAAVALDYADVDLEFGLFEDGGLVVPYMPLEQATGAWGEKRDYEQVVWRIRVPLSGQAKRWGVSATQLIIAFRQRSEVTKKTEWVRIVTRKGPDDVFSVPHPTTGTTNTTKQLRNWLNNGLPGFLSIRFATEDNHLKDQYNWDDFWNVEVMPEKLFHEGRVAYRIQRPMRELESAVADGKFREIPDFKTRY